MACSRRTRSCFVKFFRVRQSMQPSPQPITLTRRARRRMSWARLVKRVFDIEIENCPNCGGALKIIAAPSTGLQDRHRGSAGDRQNPRPSGPTHPHLASLPPHGESIYSKRPESRNRLPTQADDAARFELERAPRRGTNQALPTAASPEPTEVKPQFSPNTRVLDDSPVRR
jgi:rRNA maturation protein Nop10